MRVTIDLGAEIAAALPEMRAHAESLMRDSCTITVAGDGEPVYNPETNTSDGPPPVTLYPATGSEGKVRVQLPQIASDRPLVGGDSLTTVRYIVSIPVGVAEVPKGALITITAVDPVVGDPDLVGVELAVRSVLRKSQATALRMECEKREREA